MTFLDLAPDPERAVVSGIAAGIAKKLDVDPVLVRFVFVLLALAGGAGIVLYLALWLALVRGKERAALVFLVMAGALALRALGLSERMVAGTALVVVGLTLIWRRGGSLRPGATLSAAGVALTALGATIVLTGGSSVAFLAPGAIAGALVLIVGPWLWHLALERDAERTARIRTDERAEMATRVHDSVLQTLALIQRHSGEPKRVATLARRQERELRAWLYGDGNLGADTLLGALAAAAADVEELHGVRVELASAGDCPLDDAVRPVVLAAREAMTNAAKFSGADEVAVYAEASDGRASVFVRDRGAGFDRAAVPADRRGLSESIEGRLARAGGTATITSAPGEGTEVELVLPRRPE